ncbi:proteasome subunit beta type 7-B precursor, putative [Entamoeba histolytica HM-1:IMSS-B]|uniref:proteasome endopeptidase complex n=8 Tax=Entamoeba TaxID=5758 RepID=C4LSX4_ENTH1|nr:proteasome subunit beta type 7-B precursor, putative [Entamoeba nuttalli P19]XP_657538.1 proteasome beta subunit, putative [Entamoeba histolytica HM-1:IMSS]EMD48990.1 proteasome beta subunit, putative [Entamoeba histolytica KU27]EMH76956.1 proteasome subunit beta type 7-B precursor, putative [Entamoeba histolytica HM-1:IMSS-B]EMS15081.1 proteasome beta subunit, putative [Entamoeba histolytica HM-3:IMSS]ENY61523.1 proteasome beta subunit, putative [Entamoeba histolytica HM-1:IMSS-A]GAT91642|eukprot:XP_008859750.1 proteasome subunit beta type 7-B precursor, putative [Entamoeba nuttalli P19]
MNMTNDPLPIATSYVNDKTKFLKTGTTICGLVCDKGQTVVLACDSRATVGPIVADKACMKLHKLAPNIYCGGAGTAADLTHATNFIATKLGVHRFTIGQMPRVDTAVTMLKRHLFPYGGHIGAYLVVGGYDYTGAHLWGVYADGSTSQHNYYSLGSGSIAATTMLDDQWNENLTREEGVKLATQAILAGIFNDMGSGGRVNVCVIDKNGVEEKLNIEHPNDRKFKNPDFKGFPKKLEILKKTVIPIEHEEEDFKDQKQMELE